jgi:hypothetical protein
MGNDTALWNSSNPIGAILHIAIPIDPGLVVCTGFGPQAWVLSTIISPWDGLHPVNGEPGKAINKLKLRDETIIIDDELFLKKLIFTRKKNVGILQLFLMMDHTF